jgi:hypothetical protein
MDELTLVVLRAEVTEDCRVITDTATLARERFGSGEDAELEACAFQLARLYNVIEQLALRVAKAFENNIDDEQGWHMELLRRLSIAIPDVRAPLIPGELLLDLQELRGFRHVVRHAYDLTLRKDKLAALLDVAERVAARLPSTCETFFNSV